MLQSQAVNRSNQKRTAENMLSRAELKELQQWLAGQSTCAVEEFYRTAHHRCTLQPRWLPSPRAIQELVQAWKRLRRSR